MSNTFTDLFGSNGNYQAFNTPGQIVAGTVVEFRSLQARKFKNGQATNELDFWDDGRPKMNGVVTVQTETRDPAIENDNGRRSIYIKTWGEQRTAMVAAMAAAGADSVDPGGWFSAQYLGLGTPENPNISAPKLFKYEYRKPGGANAGELFNAAVTTPQGQQHPPAQQYQQSAPQQYATGANAGASSTAPVAAPPAPPVQQPPAPPAPPVQQPPAPPAPPTPPAQNDAAAAALLASIKSWQGAGWQDADLVGRPEFPGVSLETFAAVRRAA